MKRSKEYPASWVLWAMVFSNTSWGDVALDEAGKWNLFGDLRVRFESDFDSQTAGGDNRDDHSYSDHQVLYDRLSASIPKPTHRSPPLSGCLSSSYRSR